MQLPVADIAEKRYMMNCYNKSLTATVYIINNGRVLLHMHKKYKTWFPVGGHIEKDELPHEAALREAGEESGLNVRICDHCDDFFSIGLVKRVPRPVAVYNEGDKDEDFLDFIYAAVTDESEPRVSGEESPVFRWFTPEELLDEKENIKIHIRNTALHCFYYIQNINPRERTYFPETENSFL